MNDESNNNDFSNENCGSGRSRQKILKLIREKKPLFKNKKKIAATQSLKPEKNDFKKIVDSLNIIPDKDNYSFLKVFYEEKKVTNFDCKVMAQRTKRFSKEQLSILKLLCKKTNFSANNILNFAELIPKFGLAKLLVLRAFVDLDDVGPRSLNQFFQANLPKGDRKEMGEEEWENEILNKSMTQDQIDVFYHICIRFSGATTKIAIKILPIVRQLKQQHSQILNQFLIKESTFGEISITIKNLVSLLQLWVGIPEIKDQDRFKLLMKKLSQKLNKHQPNLQIAIQYLKDELENEKKGSFDNVHLSIRNFF